MPGKLDLYWAKSLADLNTQSEIPPGTTKNPRLLVKTASKLYKTAEDHQQLGDEEKAYVMYMKFLNVFHLMRSSPDYRKEKKYYDDLLGVSPVKAIESAENLSNSLKTRYEEKEATAAAAKLEKTHVTSLPDVPIDDSDIIEEIPVSDVTKSKSTATSGEQSKSPFIIPVELFSLVSVANRSIPLILDVRPTDQQNLSELKLSNCDVIRIPSEQIIPGMLSNKLRMTLRPDDQQLFDARSNYERIVLFDTNSTQERITPTLAIQIVKDALYKWEQTVKLKAEPQILQGGYEEWLRFYPQHSTNSSVLQKTQAKTFNIPNIDNVTFSDSSSDTDSDPAYIPASVSEKMIVPSGHSGPNTQTVPSPVRPAIDRSVKPNVSQQKAQPAIAPLAADPPASEQRPLKDSLNQLIVGGVQLPAKNAPANGSIPGTNQTKIEAYPQVDRALKPSAQAKISDSQYEKEQALSERLSAQNKRIINETSSKLQELNSQRAQLEELELMKQKESKAVVDLMRKKRRLEEDIKSQEQRLDSAKKVQQEHDTLPNVDRTKKPQKSVEDWKRSLNALERSSSSDSDSDDYDFTSLRKAHATERDSRGDRASSPVIVSPAGGLKSVSTKGGLSTPEQQGAVVPDQKSESGESVPNGAEAVDLESLNKERAKEKELEEEVKKERERIENQKRLELARARQEEESRKERERAEALKIQEMERVRKEEEAKKERERLQELERSRLEEELRKEHEKNEALKMLEVERKKQLEEERIKREKAEALKQKDAERARQEEEEKNELFKRMEQEKKKEYNKQAPNAFNGLNARSEAKSNLKKFSSQPNLLELVDDEPIVNRNLKPMDQQMELKSNIARADQQRLKNLSAVYGKVPPGQTGLYNMGNTCYMNATLQCLSHTRPLYCFFLQNDRQYTQNINTISRKGSYGRIASEFAFLLSILWSGNYQYVVPKDFKFSFGQVKPDFDHYKQMDSQEFLAFLLDILHEDLNSKGHVKAKPLGDINPNVPDADAARVFLDHYGMENDSIIYAAFTGLLKSTVTCKRCGTKSRRFDVYNCLTLEMVSDRSTTLIECLKRYLSESDMDDYKCEKCPNRYSSKKLDIWRLPSTLLISLKRFKHTYTGQVIKNTNMVDFPDKLSLPSLGQESAKEYSLYAVVNHYGTLQSGHYTAFCKSLDSNRWLLFNDENVYPMSPSDVKTSAAYVLFYSALPV